MTVFDPILHASAFVAEAFAHILPLDLTRYLLGAGGVYLLVNLALAGRLAGRKIRPTSPDAAQMRREFAASMRTVAIFALSGASLVGGGIELGLIRVDETVEARGWAWFAFNVTALICLHDAWFYWTHRLIHHRRLFRRVHRLHHRSANPSPWTAYSFNSGEAAINAVFLPLALLVVPSSGLAVFVFLVVMIIKNATGHCGYELFPNWRNGRPVFDWLTTVTHHDLHHAQPGWNYGIYFTFWDRLMGTEHPLYHEKFAQAVGTPLDGSAVAAIGGHKSAKHRPFDHDFLPAEMRRREICSGAAALAAALTLCGALLAGGLAEARSRASASAPAPSTIGGVWATQGHGAHVLLGPCADNVEELCGELVWAWDSTWLDNDADEPMLVGARWDGEAWSGGHLRNPDDGRVYRGAMTLQPDGSLKLKGCALIFCQTQVWRRVEDIPGCALAIDREAMHYSRQHG